MAQRNDFSFYKGEAVQLDFSMSPSQDISEWFIVMSVRENANDEELVYGTQLIATITNGGFGSFRFLLSHQQTSIPAGTYAYDVFRINDGHETCLSIGVMTVLQEVAY